MWAMDIVKNLGTPSSVTRRRWFPFLSVLVWFLAGFTIIFLSTASSMHYGKQLREIQHESLKLELWGWQTKSDSTNEDQPSALTKKKSTGLGQESESWKGDHDAQQKEN